MRIGQAKRVDRMRKSGFKSHPADMLDTLGSPFWSLALLAIASIPLWFSPIALSIDLGYHIIRYSVIVDYFTEQKLLENYEFVPKILPNLGMDLFGSLVIFVFGHEYGRIIVTLLVFFSVPIGTTTLTYTLYGRLYNFHYPLILLLSYSHIFVWGFANFLLGIGIGLAALAWWISRESRPTSQLIGACILGLLLMFVHALSFAIWGILLAGYEIGRWTLLQNRNPTALLTILSRAILVAVLPVIYFLMSSTVDSSQGLFGSVERIKQYPNFSSISIHVLEELISRIELFVAVPDSGIWLTNLVIGISVLTLTFFAMRSGDFRIDQRLHVPLLSVCLLILVIPPNIFGSGYVNDRMPLVFWCLLTAALGPAAKSEVKRWFAASLSITTAIHLSIVFLVYSLATFSYRDFQRKLNAVSEGGLATSVFIGEVERSSLLPYCAAFEPLAFFSAGLNVQTFNFATQQPVRLKGDLLKALLSSKSKSSRQVVLNEAKSGTEAIEQGRVEQNFRSGFDVVIVCGASTLFSTGGTAQPQSGGLLWRVYERASNPVQ